MKVFCFVLQRISHGFLLSMMFADTRDELPFVEYNGQRISGPVDAIVDQLERMMAMAEADKVENGPAAAAKKKDGGHAAPPPPPPLPAKLDQTARHIATIAMYVT